MKAERRFATSSCRIFASSSTGAKAWRHALGEDWAQDAFQAGCIGLIRGLQGWDYTKGYALSTYVSWHIRQQIQRWRWNEVALIRLPVHVWERLQSDSDDLPTAIEAAALAALNIVPIEDIVEDDLAFVWDGGLEEIAEHAEYAAVSSLNSSMT